jgi:hypothetical protein
MQRFIGILSLDTVFPRIVGDSGNPMSYHLPARVHVVSGAESTLIVRDGQPAPDLVDAFIAAAQILETEGACLITSTCGFLIQIQDRIAASVSIPVVLSSLSLLPTIRAMNGRRPIGIMTASAPALGDTAIMAAGGRQTRCELRGFRTSNCSPARFFARRATRTFISNRMKWKRKS